MTSLGRKGNTEIAGQPGSQPRAWTPGWTKVHNVFSMCLICLLTTVFSLFLPHFLKNFFTLLSSFSPVSLSLWTFLSLSLRLCGHGGKVTRSTLGRLQCVELLQVQGIICYFGKEAERRAVWGCSWKGVYWWLEMERQMHGCMDGWVRWCHIVVRFHKGELSWHISQQHPYLHNRLKKKSKSINKLFLM